MSNTEVKTLHLECGDGQQSVNYTETLEVRGRKVRIVIHRDTSYAFQSSAKADVLDPAAMRWNTVATTHYSRMKTQPPGYAGARRAAATAPIFRADRDALLAQVQDLLS